MASVIFERITKRHRDGFEAVRAGYPRPDRGDDARRPGDFDGDTLPRTKAR